MASTTTLLAWGLASYPEAYRAAGQLEEAVAAVRWAADYFMRCHVSPDELYGQVGDFSLDHRFWGRPEELNMTRPAYKIDREHPGEYLPAGPRGHTDTSVRHPMGLVAQTQRPAAPWHGGWRLL